MLDDILIVKKMHGINNITSVCYVTKCKYFYDHLTICQRVRKIMQNKYSLHDINPVRPPARLLHELCSW